MTLTDEARDAVAALTENTGRSVSEVMRCAVALERFVETELAAGSTFLVRRDDGELERIQFMFS